MCGGPERIKPSVETHSADNDMVNRNLSVETDDNSSTSLLELAADNDVDGFRRSLGRDSSEVDEVGLWYGRKKGSNRVVLEHRTPLMVAATYGSLDVIALILSLSVVDVNRVCGPENTTALHCAASGGSANAAVAVKLLLSAGADLNALDANGHRPADVIVVPPKLIDVKIALQELLGSSKVADDDDRKNYNEVALRFTTGSSSPPLSSSPNEEGLPSADLALSPMMMTNKFADLPQGMVSEKREYPVDPSLPDIKNSIYATDEFRMFSFKVRPCSRAYSHDWTECPFVHPGENARRRDPRKYHYSCVPCPEFRKGACRRGDMCEYAHGVFECWLHPAQYRTRLCKDGTSCNRRVCFFAHTNEELRPLYVSTGSAVPSPRSATTSAAMDMAVAMGLMPGSPSAVSAAMMSPFTPPISPSANGMGHSLGWSQQNVPTLHLPGSNLQSSRLRTSLSARDMPVDDLSVMSDLDAQLLNELCYSRLGSSAGNRVARTKTLTPSNLDDLFSAEMAFSPRYNSDQGTIFSPSHKAVILNQYQQQQQSLASPINTNVFSPKAIDSQQHPGHPSLLQASLGISPPSRMSPRGMEPASPMNSRLLVLAQREKQHQQQTLRSLSSRDLGSGTPLMVGSPVNSSMPKWGSPTGAVDWGVSSEELGPLRRSSSFELRCGSEEPDLSWVHSLVKESPPEKLAGSAAAVTSGGPSAPILAVAGGRGGSEGSNSSSQLEGHEQAAVLGAWLDQMELNQMVV